MKCWPMPWNARCLRSRTSLPESHPCRRHLRSRSRRRTSETVSRSLPFALSDCSNHPLDYHTSSRVPIFRIAEERGLCTTRKLCAHSKAFDSCEVYVDGMKVLTRFLTAAV